MPSADEYLALSPSNRVVAGPFKTYGEADTEAKKHNGYVQFIARDGAPAAEAAPVLHEGQGALIAWRLSGAYVGTGRSGTSYEIRPTVMKGKRTTISWSLWRDGKKVDVSSRTDKLMHSADAMEKDASPKVGASEVVPVLHEGAAEAAGDCVAIVERTPGCASSGRVVKNAHDVWLLLEERYRRTGKEVFEVILLNLRSEMLGSPVQIATGQRDAVSVDIEQVLAPIVKGSEAGCVAVILVHLHPSGHARPSPDDKRLTDKLRSGMLVAAPRTTLVDHVIVAPRAKGGTFYSFTEDKTFRVK